MYNDTMAKRAPGPTPDEISRHLERLRLEARLIHAIEPFGLSLVDLILSIYLEDSPKDLSRLLEGFLAPSPATDAERDEAIDAITQAWNNLPHYRLDDRSPAEMMHETP